MGRRDVDSVNVERLLIIYSFNVLWLGMCSVARYVWNVIAATVNCSFLPRKVDELHDWIMAFKGNRSEERRVGKECRL